MAKKSIIAREKKREKLVGKYAERRKELRKIAKDIHLDMDERMQAQVALQRLPKNSAHIRLRSRCALTGRPRAVYRKFKLSRNMIRLHAMFGEIPGLVKSSW